jgi:hypothetical protein
VFAQTQHVAKQNNSRKYSGISLKKVGLFKGLHLSLKTAFAILLGTQTHV